MKFVMYQSAGTEGLAIETDTGLRGLSADSGAYPGDLDTLIRAGAGALARAGDILANGDTIDPDAITYLPPFRRAEKIFCIGLNYHDHRAETGNAAAQIDYPAIFSRFTSSLIGHGEAIVMPKVSDKLDYEAEMVAVIGKPGRYIGEEEALGYVAGYSIFNDGSIRDYQRRTPQWTIGKNFDATGGFGPGFVTADALPAGGAGLTIECRLNGETMQSATTDDLIFSVAKLVSLLSEAVTLQPGDLIVTGTPGGVGAARKPQVFMKPGDVCEVEIERIGLLRNPIAGEA